MNNKAQIQQVFTYILTIILVGFVLLMGYRAIIGLIDKGCEVEKASFKTNIESMISKFNNYGSLNREGLNGPCDFSQVCFIDTQIIRSNTAININNPLIFQSTGAGVEKNIFLVKHGLTEPVGFVEQLKVDNSQEYICINNTNGKFEITFRGDGKNTYIEPSE
jgi:hypothetical protein